ncbi:MAG TPA: flagellar basal body-associated FliL family protein [Fibrobacteria bacterium]|nr:flagellar basal body-associated FliL family protein [Fibrobacteria bacterium]
MSEEKPKGGAPATEEKGEAADKKPAKKPVNKKIIIIAAILVADLGIMAGLGFFIVGKLKGGTVDPAEAAKHAKEEAEKAENEKKHELTKIGMVLPKPLPFTVNIGGGTASHYLKCAIQLEWDGAEHAAGGGGGHGGGAPAALDATGNAIVERMPKITDIIINILSSQSYEELLQPSGKQKIKEAIVTEINAILPEPVADEHAKKDEHAGPPPSGKLRNAFFTEFIVQ